jgi:hypothetical protein
MVYEGHVKNGMVVVDDPVSLADGTKAEVEIAVPASSDTPDLLEPTLYEQLAPLVGAAKGLPPDLARSHDHYLHREVRK